MNHDRDLLLHWAEQGHIALQDLPAALRVAGVFPGPAQWRRFIDRLLLFSGVVLVCAGIIFFSSGLILLCSGALAELIYARGDVRDREFLRLTQTILAGARNPGADRTL